jgi:trimethylamine:corrinoid methyltransferase-like protein
VWKIFEVLQPSLATRESWSQWQASGAVPLWEKAAQKADHLIQKHEVVPLEQVQVTELVKVIESYNRHRI